MLNFAVDLRLKRYEIFISDEIRFHCFWLKSRPTKGCSCDA